MKLLKELLETTEFNRECDPLRKDNSCHTNEDALKFHKEKLKGKFKYKTHKEYHEKMIRKIEKKLGLPSSL